MNTKFLKALAGVSAVALLAAVASAQPANDDCAMPTVLTPGSTSGDTTGATGTDISTCAFNDALDVWFTFTAPSAGAYTFNTIGTTVDTVLSAFDVCNGAELACNDDGGGFPVSRFALALTQNQVVLIRLAGYNNTQGAYVLNVVAPPPPPANDTCATGAAVSLPYGYNQDIAGALEDTDASCNDGAATGTQNGVWFTYTPAANQLVRFTESTGVNVVFAIYSGACDGLTEVRCTDAEDFAQPLTGGTTYHILVGAFAALPLGAGSTINLSMSEIIAPGNDTCGTAVAVGSLPFSSSVDAFGAQEDLDVACNAATATGTQNGIWFTYTPPANQLVRFRESGTANTVIAIFSGACDGLSEAYCSDPEDFVQTLTGGTTYRILVGGQGALPVAGNALFTLELTEVQAPTNDTCATARDASVAPFSDTVDISTATNDIDVGCNSTANTETRNGVWYRVTTTDGGRISLSDSSSNDIVFSIFTGPCDSLTEVYCSDAEAPAPAFEAAANTTYYILAGMWSTTTIPTAPLGLSINFVPITGSCCIGSNCTVTIQSACTGTWGGPGTNCGGTTGYNLVPGTGVFEDISGTGTLATTASGCDDCGQTIPIGFTFNFLGNSYTNLWIVSNGYIQFGGVNNTTYVNAPIPTAGVPDNFIAPFWDDLNPGVQGDIYYRLAGAPGSQTLTISWQNVTQFAATTSESFQLILTEGSNGIEYRYGTITAETPAGDYTVGYESADGLSGGSTPGSAIGSGNVSLVLSNANPCGSGGGNGACCQGANCTVTSQAACTGFATAFTGANTVCNVFGVNNVAPCCKGDYNHVGGITVQDIFDFLSGYFTQDPKADANGSGTITVQDIFDYLFLYFNLGC